MCTLTYFILKGFIAKLCIFSKIDAHFRDRAERGEAGGAPEVVRRQIVDNVLVDFRFYLQ